MFDLKNAGVKGQKVFDPSTTRPWSVAAPILVHCWSRPHYLAASPLRYAVVNRGPLKMHARSWLCIFNEVCLKYLIAWCSFEKQIRLYPLIFDTEMNICKTHTLISLFWSIVSVWMQTACFRTVAPHRLRWCISCCGASEHNHLIFKVGFSILYDYEHSS